MITLRCTKRLRDFLDVVPAETSANSRRTDSILGDWYANLIPTTRGPLVIFVNERTLLTVAVPADNPSKVVPLFIMRVANLLDLLDIPHKVIDKVAAGLNPILVGRTQNRRVLGSMNEIAFHYQVEAEYAADGPLSLSDTELKFSGIPHSPNGYRLPRELVRELLLDPQLVVAT